MYFTHEDLRDNVDTSLNHDYTGGGSIYTPLVHHGTHVAGIITARDNSIGVRGVAPRATVYGYNYLVETTVSNRADAMARNRDVTAVSNNSWGPRGGPGLGRAGSFWELAVNAGVETGYDGRGVFYAFAGGNGHELGDNSNLDELANYYGVTAVCAVNDGDTRSNYSEMGANLWVCAPSNDLTDLHQGVLTTENSDRYYEEFGGTSASTPVVAGVAALMRSANPDLTWRDLKLILAASARKNDASNSGWLDGARKYMGSSEDRYHFNHEYGFGVVDAGAAVDLAKGWTNAPPLKDSSVTSGRLNQDIPDAPLIGSPTTITETLILSSEIGFTEFVEVEVNFDHLSFRDLDIQLVSPSGSVSKLAVPFDTFGDDDPSTGLVPLRGAFRFGSARHLGEDPNGEWQLRVTDEIWLIGGALDSWSVTVYGHERIPDPPTVDSVTASAGSLNVAWNAPVQAGRVGAITSYDLRHIETAADEEVDSNWTVVEDVWTATAGGSLEYTITGLVDGARYDVQVRAVSAAGEGPWSAGATGTPGTPSDCATGGAVADAANNPGLVDDCEALLAARDLLATRLANGEPRLNWSADTPISEWDGIGEDSLEGSPMRVTRLYLDGLGLDGSIPGELAELTALKELYLYGNELTGPIPAELGNLTRLTHLHAYDNDLSGEIPAALGDLAELRELRLDSNDLSGQLPPELGNLTRVTRLWFADNDLSGTIPPELGNMSSLDWLNLGRNNIGGEIPAELGNPSRLRRLYIYENDLSGPIPSSLGNLSRLTHIVAQANDLSGEIPPEMGNLSNLVWMGLHDNDLTGEIPEELGNLAKLQRFYLTNNELYGPVPDQLGNLSELTNLFLSYNYLSGQIPQTLGDLGRLSRLRLAGNPFTGCLPAGLAAVRNSDADQLSLGVCSTQN